MADRSLKMGKKQCPRCAETVKAEAKACRHCGYEFTDEEMKRQAEFEAINQRRGKIGCGVVLLIALAVGTCALQEANRPLTPQEKAAKAAESEKQRVADAELMARASAAAVVKERLKNPSSFELIDAQAMPGKTDDGKKGWMVGVTYRATNSFGAIITENAIVSVDESGETPLKVVDIR